MVLHAADMRREYSLAGLDESDLDADPIRQFGQWFAEAQAAEVPEPNAMVLATASAGRRAGGADRPAQGVRRARIPLLLELREPERPRSGAESARRVDVLLGRSWSGRCGSPVSPSGSAATNPGSISTAVPWEVASRPVSPARARSLAAGEQLASGVQATGGAIRRRCDPATRLLGRLPGGPGVDRVLAGTPEPAPRPAPLSPRGTTAGSSSACHPNPGRGRLSPAAPSSALRPPRRARRAG